MVAATAVAAVVAMEVGLAAAAVTAADATRVAEAEAAMETVKGAALVAA